MIGNCHSYSGKLTSDGFCALPEKMTCREAEIAPSARSCACQDLITSGLSEARPTTAMRALIGGTLVLPRMVDVCSPVSSCLPPLPVILQVPGYTCIAPCIVGVPLRNQVCTS